MATQPQWVLTQKKTFTKWANVQLNGDYIIKDAVEEAVVEETTEATAEVEVPEETSKPEEE